MAEQITESVQLAEAESLGSGKYKVLCISEGRGSSGVYPRETLIEAANNKLIGRSTFAYLDHPSASEAHDRPERSVRDLAGVFTSDAYWDENHKGLVAEMQVFAPYRELIAEMKDHIGLSIRGDGEIEMREGQRTITSLSHIQSVDWVTKAGRGGRVLELLESARPDKVNARAVRHGIAEATANDVREQLQAALRTAHAGFRWVYVRDFDDSRVWFEGTTRSDDDQALTTDATYQQSYATDGAAVTLTGGLTEVRQVISYVPVNPTAAPTTTQEALVAELSEADAVKLRSSVAEAEAARDTALAEAATTRAELDAYKARDTARPGIAAKVAESKTLGARTQARLVESVLAALPIADGKVDEPKLAAAIESAVKTAQDEIADYTPPAPANVFGTFGSLAESAGQPADITESDIDASVGSAFGRTAKGN